METHILKHVGVQTYYIISRTESSLSPTTGFQPAIYYGSLKMGFAKNGWDGKFGEPSKWWDRPYGFRKKK